LLEMIGNSQGFKTFWIYSKALLENYFKLSIIFLRNLLEKNLKSKYHFLAFNQLYASLLAKDCFTKFALFNMGYFFQTIIECVSQSLFYKPLFHYFRKNRVQTPFLLFYASKAITLNWDLLLKTLLWFWKHVCYCSGLLFWILETLQSWFEVICF
jgi:hypothetical protein